MRHRYRHVRPRDQGDINITAFMNLMVILVPFLLITAVFSRITILELNLPAAQTGAEPPPDTFALEVVLRKDSLEVGDRSGGLIKRFARVGDSYDYQAVSELLQQVKGRFPDKQDVTLLLEAEIPYDALVQAMDVVRMADVVQAGSVVKVELFPQISIGDAPPANDKVAAANGG